MKKHKDIIYMTLLALILLGAASALVYMVQARGSIYGSDIDWLSQHYTLADYIRENFYDTKSLLPDFSMNLGAGQNFAQLIYYGVLRPEIVVSFLFPFIKMKDYLTISTIFLLLLSAELFYYWLKKEEISSTAAFISSIIFAFAGPLLFHTHRHIMFMNYMPWLVLAFIGIRRYILKNKSDIMILGVFLMVMASYFFSVSGIIMCGIYSIYCIIRYYEPTTFKKFITKLMQCCLHVGVGVGIAALILVPAAFSMMGSQRNPLHSPTIYQLLKPDMDFSALLVHNSGAYTVGLTAIVIAALLYSLYVRNLANRILSCMIIAVSLFPVFNYILNGMQYVREKSMIPILPLAVFLIAYMIDRIPKKKDHHFLYILPLLFVPYFFMKAGTSRQLYLIDACILFILLSLYIVKRWKALMFAYLVVPSYFLITVNKSEHFVSSENWATYDDSQKKEMITNTLDKDEGFYRFDDVDYARRTVNQVLDIRMNKTSAYSSNYNNLYNTYFYKVMHMPSINPTNTNMLTSQNPFFQGMMGVKYLYTKQNVPYGYKTIEKHGTKKVIENDHVLPIAYASSQLMSEDDFKHVQYPYTLDTIYNRSIVPDATTDAYESQIKKVKPSYTITSKDKTLDIKKVKDGYRVKASTSSDITVKLDQPIKDQVMILRLPVRDVKNGKNMDTSIRVNGSKNMLSKSNYLYKNDRYNFDYFLSQNTSWNTISIRFSKGEYTIKNPQAYIMDGSVLDKRQNSIDKMKFEHKKGKILAGSINVQKKGYFITSLPYQKGYEIRVDGKMQTYTKVNTAFVGFPIDKGVHTVEIAFVMPGKKIGIMMSVLCLFIAGLLYCKGRFMKRVQA